MTITPLLADAGLKRNQIRSKALAGLNNLFPIKAKNKTIVLEDAELVRKNFTTEEEKQAILNGKSLHETIKGTLILKDNKGKVLNKVKNFTLMHLPYFTKQHTFVVEGNSYAVGNQLRTKSGIYTRVRGNDVIESSFNLSKGSNFKVTMDPESSVFHIELGGAKIPLWPLLSALGVTPSKLQSKWGKDIAQTNINLTEAKKPAVIDRIYKRFVSSTHRSPSASNQEKIDTLRAYFSGTVLDPVTTERTLGTPISSVTGDAIVTATAKLLSVYKGEETVDDRDSLEFQRIHSVDDFVKERIQKAGKEIIRKLSYKVDNAKEDVGIKSLVPSNAFGGPVKALLTQFNLSRTPDQINPIEILDGAVKVTRLGEGGISDTRAIPEVTRYLHHTHLGILDPVRTPESSRAGVDVRAALTAAKDDEGNIYAQLIDVKAKKLRHVPVAEISKKVIAFPTDNFEGQMDVIKDGVVTQADIKNVDFMVPTSQTMLSPATALLPFMESMQGNRALMGAKMMTQALPLKHREAPLVQVALPTEADTVQKELGNMIITKSPVAGTVVSKDTSVIKIKDAKGKMYEVDFSSYFPYNSKTYLHEEPTVSVGDKVKKDQRLTDSNYTVDGVLALGRNMKVAYMPYLGKNSNDAIVISEKAAKDLTSLHMYKKTQDIDRETVVDRRKWINNFPNKHNVDTVENIDNDGVIKKDTVVNYGDPLILSMSKSKPSETDKMLGRLHKSLVKPYRDTAVVWDKEYAGVVQDVAKTKGRVSLTVKTEAPMQVGDKLANSYGGKGTVSEIIPDGKMPHTEDGVPIDILLTSAGVVSRINPGQVLENALGKVAKKSGEVIVLNNFGTRNNLEFTEEKLQQAGVKDKETVVDPLTGRKIPNIAVGYQNIMKLFKTTDTNFAARGLGSYDTNMQPTKGGIEGAKRLGKMEVDALLAHGAENIVSEAVHLKGQKNDDWWNAFKLSLPLPQIKEDFVTNKLDAMLFGSSIKVDRHNHKVKLSALTDKDIKDISSGTIDNADVLRKKDLKPEVGGLFDPYLTGGLDGNKWADIKYTEPNLKPAFAKPVSLLLNDPQVQVERDFFNRGGKQLKKRLDRVDLNDMESKLKQDIDTSRGSKLDNAVKTMKIVKSLKQSGLKPSDAYMGEHLAVIPPIMRPVVPGPNDTLLVSDANHLYRDVILSNKQLSKMNKAKLPEEEKSAIRKQIYEATKAVAGLGEPTSRKLKEQKKKGFIKQITGPRPSEGYYQQKVVGRPQDLSGRGTAVVDPTLKIDQVGLPEDMAWKMYEPFIVKRLVGQGYPAMEAQDRIDSKDSVAQGALETEINSRPVLLNRAPSLWRHSVVGAYPKLIPGKSIAVNPFIEEGLNLDFDGDTLQLHTPVTSKAVSEARGLTVDKQLFSDKKRDDLLVFPAHESIFGINAGTKKHRGKTYNFDTTADAMKAYFNNEVNMDDNVKIGK